MVAYPSSLVTPPAMFLARDAGVVGGRGGRGSLPATPSPARRCLARESSRGSPGGRASAAGLPPCSPGDTPAAHNNTGGRAGAHQARRTACNGHICAARPGSCLHRSAAPPRRQPFRSLRLTPVTGGRKSTRLRKTFLVKSWKNNHPRRPQEDRESQTARRR
jgi:hypothetical protein